MMMRMKPSLCLMIFFLLFSLSASMTFAQNNAPTIDAGESGANKTSDLRCNTDFDPEAFKKSKIDGIKAEIASMNAAMSHVPAATATSLQQSIANKQSQLARFESGKGIISTIVEEIQGILNNSYETMYEAIRASNVANIAAACMVLYVIIFGIMFTLGMVQAPLNDVVKRLIKMIFVASIVGEGGFAFFNDTIYRFFREGTDALLSEMTTIIASRIGGGGGAMYQSGDGVIGPFAPMDMLIESLINPSTLQILQAGASTPPYGTIYIIILLIGFVFLLGAIARALWVYLVSLIATTFLFGLAPLFVITILFERTKNMFSAWLNQLINFSLQPILMFTFIGFFIILMQESLTSILDLKVCYGAMPGSSVSGTPWEPVGLQFVDKATDQLVSVDFQSGGMKCVINNVLQACPGPVQFPLDLIDILTFLLLGYVAYQFYNYVIDIASDIAGSFVNLEVGSPVQGVMQDMGGRIDKGVAALATGQDPMAAMGLNMPGGTPRSNPSDRRLKENIVSVGEKNGIPLYHFNYIGDSDMYEGVMADEVAHIPGAVVRGEDGYLRVYYDVLGIPFRKLN